MPHHRVPALDWSTRRREIGGLTERILERAAVTGPPVPIVRLARARGAKVRYVPFEGELSGMLYREAAVVVIGVNSTHSRPRQRFTVAHELGHLELHTTDTLHIDRDFRVLRRDATSSAAVDPWEIEANAFAAQILMPTSFLAADLAGQAVDCENDALVRRLATRYKVSTQAMLLRLNALGHLSQF